MWSMKTMNCFRQDVYFAEIVCDLNIGISTTKLWVLLQDDSVGDEGVLNMTIPLKYQL